MLNSKIKNAAASSPFPTFSPPASTPFPPSRLLIPNFPQAAATFAKHVRTSSHLYTLHPFRSFYSHHPQTRPAAATLVSMPPTFLFSSLQQLPLQSQLATTTSISSSASHHRPSSPNHPLLTAYHLFSTHLHLHHTQCQFHHIYSSCNHLHHRTTTIPPWFRATPPSPLTAPLPFFPSPLSNLHHSPAIAAFNIHRILPPTNISTPPPLPIVRPFHLSTLHHHRKCHYSVPCLPPSRASYRTAPSPLISVPHPPPHLPQTLRLPSPLNIHRLFLIPLFFHRPTVGISISPQQNNLIPLFVQSPCTPPAIKPTSPAASHHLLLRPPSPLSISTHRPCSCLHPSASLFFFFSFPYFPPYIYLFIFMF